MLTLLTLHNFRATELLLELITFEILAAERLRLMAFDKRLIIAMQCIDCFANVVNIFYGNFLQMIDSEVRNMNALLRRSRNERSQFIVENKPQ